MAEMMVTRDGVNWRQVGAFVGLTFTLTWLLNLMLWLTAGYGKPSAVLLLQLQMLIPAFSALVLGLFLFRGSRIGLGRVRGASRWFALYYLAYTLAYVALGIGAMAAPELLPTLSGVALGLTLLGPAAAVLMRVLRGRGALSGIGVIGAQPRYWLLFGLGFLLFYAGQTLLNYLFGLGHPADLSPLASQANMPGETLLVAAGIQSVLVAPFMALMIAFGEEYGWRGYLQGELVKMGRARGILLVGVIWGLWHAPIIAMGHNYPGYPVAGIFLMVGYTVLLGYVLGYAVLKTGSVWLAAYLHALNNQGYSYLAGLIYTPNDPVFSFGIGLYGLACLAVVVLLILRDPVWREGLPATAAKLQNEG